MTEPPSQPVPAAADARPAWAESIETLLAACRRHDPTEPDGPPPVWLAPAADQLGDWLQQTITAQVAQETTALHDRLADARRDATTTRTELYQLRNAIRLYLAELIASDTTLDRDDANNALRGWDIEPLPARFAISLTVTLSATVIADDSTAAVEQAHQIIEELARDNPDETVTIGELHTDEVVELDELPDPVALR